MFRDIEELEDIRVIDGTVEEFGDEEGLNISDESWVVEGTEVVAAKSGNEGF